MKRSIWFRKTISLGHSQLVTIPAELVDKWKVTTGEQMCWSLDHGVVTFKPSRLAVQYDPAAAKELEKLRKKGDEEQWKHPKVSP